MIISLWAKNVLNETRKRSKKKRVCLRCLCLCLPLSLLRHVIVMMLTGRVGAMTSRLTQTSLPMSMATPFWLLTVTYLVPFAAAAAWRRNGQHDITISVVAGVCLHLSHTHTPTHTVGCKTPLLHLACIRFANAPKIVQLALKPTALRLCVSVFVCVCSLCSCFCGLLVIHGRAAYR